MDKKTFQRIREFILDLVDPKDGLRGISQARNSKGEDIVRVDVSDDLLESQLPQAIEGIRLNVRIVSGTIRAEDLHQEGNE